MASSRFHNFIFGENNTNHTNPYFSNQSYNSLNTTSPQQCILVEKHYIPLELYQTLYPSQNNNNSNYVQPPIYANSNHFSYFTDPIINTNQPQQQQQPQPQQQHQPQPFSNIIDLLFTIPLNTATNDENTINNITIDILSKNSVVSIYDVDVDADTDDSSSSTNSTCSVCLDIIRNGTIIRKLTSCNHIFHLECIDKWVATNYKCPLCRTNINPDSTTMV